MKQRNARAMAEALTAAGFKVTRQFDTGRDALFKAFDSFVLGVKKEDEVVFFFSGHGVQLGSDPYLLPVDIQADSDRQVASLSLSIFDLAQPARLGWVSSSPTFGIQRESVCRLSHLGL